MIGPRGAGVIPRLDECLDVLAQRRLGGCYLPALKRSDDALMVPLQQSTLPGKLRKGRDQACYREPPFPRSSSSRVSLTFCLFCFHGGHGRMGLTLWLRLRRN